MTDYAEPSSVDPRHGIGVDFARSGQPWPELGLAGFFLFVAFLFGTIVFFFAQIAVQALCSLGVLPGEPAHAHAAVPAHIATALCVIGLTLGRDRFVGWDTGWDMGSARRWVWPVVSMTVLAIGPAAMGTDGMGLDSVGFAARAGPIWLTLILFKAVVLVPVAEELFFRGWLWAALRPVWGVWPTALCTAVPWVLSQAGESPRALWFAVPAAIILSVQRHRLGSAWGTVVTHVTYQATLAMSGLLFALYGQSAIV